MSLPLQGGEQGAGAVDAVACDPHVVARGAPRRLICEEDAAAAVRPPGTEGAVVSAAAWVVALAEADCAEAFPAASSARTV